MQHVKAVDLQMVVVLLLLLPCATGILFWLEAELYMENRMAYPRTKASGKWAVHFYQSEVFPIEFCVQSSTTIAVTNIRYSNDGASDYVEVRLDGERLDTFHSLQKFSGRDEWNQFEDTGKLGSPVTILAGKHRLELTFISTDRHGMEVDYVAVDIANEEQDERMLQCTAYCDDTINYKPELMSDMLPTGTLRQKSERTTCTEEQNVKLELHHPGLKSYRLTANFPRYKTLLDNRRKDFHACTGSERGQVVWYFNDFDVLTSAYEMVYMNSTVLSFNGSDFARNSKLRVQFPTDQLTRITLPNAILRLKFHRTPAHVGTVHLQLTLNGSDTLVADERATDPSKSDNEVSWVLDTKMLMKQGEAELRLTVVHQLMYMLHVDYLRLELQPVQETAIEVYRDTMTIVKGIRNPTKGGMKLFRPDNQSSWGDMEAVTVLKKASWSEEYEEIFRLDRNGHMWLKPRSAYASSSPPYSTSAVIGPCDPQRSDSITPITRIDVDPYALRFTVTYGNSSKSDILFRAGPFGVRAIVTHKQWSSDALSGPLVMVKSMWVADGNADVDHVSANGASPREVLSGWETLHGTSFAFFRQCVSRHNTQSPDITLDLLEAFPILPKDTHKQPLTNQQEAALDKKTYKQPVNDGTKDVGKRENIIL